MGGVALLPVTPAQAGVHAVGGMRRFHGHPRFAGRTRAKRRRAEGWRPGGDDPCRYWPL